MPATYNVSYVYQDEPLGLGHAVHCAAEKTGDEPFYVLLGDVLVPDNNMLPRHAEGLRRAQRRLASSPSCPCPMTR